MYNKNYFEKLSNLPFILLGVIILICSFGFIALWATAGGNIEPWASRQIMKFCLFLPISILIATIDFKIIFKFSYPFYIVILMLLIGIELFGHGAKGATRWIDLGFISLQPSELTKLAIVLVLARYFHELKAHEVNKTYKLVVAIILVLVPALLIIKQPDLGTGLITIIVSGIIFFAAGVHIWKFIIVGGGALVSIPVIWHMMYDYQRKRVLVFLDPEMDPLASGYNIIQSKIAIGSGGLFGKGLGNGTQSTLKFLPEHQTDFIFASLAEEFGFVGCAFLVLLYSIVIFISLAIAINCRSMFCKLMVIGITTIFFSHIFINIAMVMGLLPAVGVPLPFVSYGGTMMASMLIGFGLIMNAKIHQYISFEN